MVHGAYSRAPLLPFSPLSTNKMSSQYRQSPPGQFRVDQVTQLRIDGVHCRGSTGARPVVLKTVPVTGACPIRLLHGPTDMRPSFPKPTIIYNYIQLYTIIYCYIQICTNIYYYILLYILLYTIMYYYILLYTTVLYTIIYHYILLLEYAYAKHTVSGAVLKNRGCLCPLLASLLRNNSDGGWHARVKCCSSLGVQQVITLLYNLRAHK